MAQPILNPAVPGTHALRFGVRAGLQIAINGLVSHKTKEGFQVNLVAGGDFALHVSFRWDKEKAVAMNAKLANAWGNELKHANPLHHDQPFDLQIRVYPGYFHITSNGVLLCDFPHRIPFETIQAIEIAGKVHINNISFSQFQ